MMKNELQTIMEEKRKQFLKTANLESKDKKIENSLKEIQVRFIKKVKTDKMENKETEKNNEEK